jgi:predicted ATPase
MTIDGKMRKLLVELLGEVRSTGAYPQVKLFRVAHETDRRILDAMIKDRLIEIDSGRYVPTLEGLRECNTPEARAELDTAAGLIPFLQAQYRELQDAELTSSGLAFIAGKPEPEVQRALALLRDLPVWSSVHTDPATGFVNKIQLTEGILDLGSGDIAPRIDDRSEPGEVALGRQLTRIEIDGYRPFRKFVATPGELTVVIGANATGKSSLFDFLRFIRHAVAEPLPPEIDERAAGKALFHAGQPQRMAFALTLDLGHRSPVRYEAEILGPVGEPKVIRERLATIEPLSNNEQEPFVFLNFSGGRGVVRDQRERKLVRPQWTVRPNELALRRALDPTLVTLSRAQALLSSWRFFSGFDVSSGAVVRRPVPTEPEPALLEDGSNLSAVLLWLNHKHPTIWEELESHLRSAVPGFRSLNVEPRGGPGMVIGVWTETGVAGELTLADLSDGTLRLLCWAVLCLSPKLPPLICIDEPEIGLHPRVLPVLAGLLRLASARAQILVATHSPYFLSHFALDEIAVMRKQDGAAQFVRPSTSKALRDMVHEVGGEALTRLHLSDELETLA